MVYRRVSLSLISLMYFCSYGIHQISIIAPKLNKITCEQKVGGDLKREEEIFIRSFSQAYNNLPPEALGTKNGIDFLKDMFESERKALNEKKEEIYFFTVKINNTPIGLTSFNRTNNPNEIYLRHLAIDPIYQKQGIEKILVFLCLKEFPSTQKIIVATRKLNGAVQNFYTKLGFKCCKELPKNIPHIPNPELYVAFEYTVPVRQTVNKTLNSKSAKL
jgi:ribosomal protein S18 acetylase RimI-like enzyme